MGHPLPDPPYARDPLPLPVNVSPWSPAPADVRASATRSLAACVACVMLHRFRPYDESHPWGGDGTLPQITPTITAEPGPRGITVNTVDPGPVQTGYIEGELLERVVPMFALGRLGEPDDPARLLSWPATDEAAWITGQVIGSEGGFRFT